MFYKYCHIASKWCHLFYKAVILNGERKPDRPRPSLPHCSILRLFLTFSEERKGALWFLHTRH